MMAQTLVGRVLALGQSLSHEPAVLFRKETLNYTDLKERIMRCAAFLSGLGVGRGDRVLFTALSRPETVVIYLGIQYIGAIAVFMDKNSTAEDGRQIYEETQASLYVTDRPIGEDPSGRMRIFSLKELYTACAKTETGSSGIPAYRYPEEEDIAEVLFTTGTTGRPKGVMLSYRAVYQISKNTTNGIGILSTDRILIPLPLNHSLALRELRSALWMGAAVVLQNGFTFAKDVERNIKELGCTGMVTVPASLELIRGQMQNRFSEIVGSLRYIEVGAGSLSVRQRREFTTLLPDTRLNNTWGSSETGGALFMDVNEAVKDPVRIVAVGKPLDGISIRMLDADGKELRRTDHNHPGRLALQGEMIMSGYWNLPEETKDALRDGWLVTNDLVYTDEDGYVYMLGRADDIINVGGEKVAPVEVENVAGEFPAIRECACIGVPDPKETLGQIPVLFLVQGNGFSLDELKRYLYAKMERYKIPQEYVTVPALPGNRMKKPDRKAMRALWDKRLREGMDQEDSGADVSKAVLEKILSRRSVRRFKTWPVPEELLNQILQAGLYAPNGNNLQTWRFTVVRRPEQILRLKKAAFEASETQKVKCYGFENPACLILISNKNRNPNSCQDASCAAENMLLAAHVLGLGACWLNMLRTLRDVEPVKSILDEFGIPEEHTVWSMIALGYSAEGWKEPAKRKNVIYFAD